MATPRGVSHQEATPRAADGKGKAKPKAKAKPAPPAHPWWWHVTPAGIKNDLRFEARRLQKENAGYRVTGPVFGLGLAAPGSMFPALQYEDPKGRVRYSTPVQRDFVYGATVRPVKATANLAINLAQSATNGWKPADPASSPVGRAVEQVDRAAKNLMGVKQDWQRDPDGLLYQQLGSDLTTSAIGGVAGHALVPAAAFTAGAFRALSPAMQQALRWGAGTAVESMVSTALTDNRLPQTGNLANAFGPDAPFAVQPQDDMVTATAKSLIPNAIGEMALGLGVLGLGKAAGRGLDGLSNITRRQREGRAAQEVVKARQFTKEAGLQEELDAGEHRFTPEAKETPPAPAAAPAAAPGRLTQAQAEEQLLGRKETPPAEAAPAAAPAEAAPAAAPAEAAPAAAAPEQDPIYSPDLPEVDAAVMAADRLDDERLAAAAQSNGPVLPELERHLGEQEDGFAVMPGLSAEQFSGPTEALASPLVPFRDQWEATPHGTLKSLAHPDNSPELFSHVQALTGRQWEDFTKADVLDGLDAMAQSGKTVIPNRAAADATVLPLDQVHADPIRFQYKENVDAEGRQKGNSLEGVKHYNTDLEDRIDVWLDPADGKTYVVNGHNRLALANSKGIGSIRVNYLAAQTAEQARALGALKNIAQGAGTPFDAAKAIREMGIADAAGLEAAGIPLQSGLGAQGLALSKLPGALFQQAVNGELSMGRALALGASNLDPEDMIRVSQLAAGRDLSERGFAELVQLAGTAPKVADAPQGGIPGLDEWMQDSAIFEQAELAGKIRAELISNKNLFKKVGRAKSVQQLAKKGGTAINQDQVMTAANASQAVLAEFDRDKLLSGTPMNQLLNQGALDIKAGAKPAVIVKRILQQLEAAAEVAPPAPKVEVPTTNRTEEFWASESPEQRDRRAERARASLLSAPSPLTPEARKKLKAEVVRRAIQNGEVRPSATPLPDLPDPPSDLTNPQALLQDELRLAKEYGVQDTIQDQLELDARRKAMGWDDMTLEEKKSNGMLDEWEKPSRFYHAAPAQEFVLPKELAGAKPRYGYRDLNFEVSFSNDFDRAAYTLAGDVKGTSKRAAKYRQAFKEAGYDIREVTAHGQKVKAALKERAQAWKPDPENRSIQALELPAQAFEGGNVRITDSLADIADEKALLDAWQPVERFPLDDQKKLRDYLQVQLGEIIARITGEEAPEVRFVNAREARTIAPPEHGGDGKAKGERRGFYNPMADLIQINGMLGRAPAELIETTYHESFHRLQYTLMNKKEMEAFDSVFGRLRVDLLSDIRGVQGKAIIEKQAYAFQAYAAYRSQGLDASTVQFREQLIAAMDTHVPRKDNKSWAGTFRGEAALLIFQAFNKVLDLLEAVNNAVRGRGFTTVQDFYEKAYSGELAKSRALDFAKEFITKDQMARIQTIDRWKKNPRAAAGDITAMVQDLDGRINELKAQAIQGGC